MEIRRLKGELVQNSNSEILLRNLENENEILKKKIQSKNEEIEKTKKI